MSVFNSSNISEKSASTFLEEKGIPVDDAGWINKLSGLGLAGLKVEIFDSGTSSPDGTFDSPRIGIVASIGSGESARGVASVWLYNKTQSDTEWTKIYPQPLPNNALVNGDIEDALINLGLIYPNTAIAGPQFEVETVFDPSSIDPPEFDASSPQTLRVYASVNNNDVITEIHQAWLFMALDVGLSGQWVKLYPQEAEASGGGGSAPQDARTFQTQFSPNGLFMPTHRGETLVTSSSINNGVVSSADLKIWYAYNSNSNNSWVQLN